MTWKLTLVPGLAVSYSVLSFSMSFIWPLFTVATLRVTLPPAAPDPSSPDDRRPTNRPRARGPRPARRPRASACALLQACLTPLVGVSSTPGGRMRCTGRVLPVGACLRSAAWNTAMVGMRRARADKDHQRPRFGTIFLSSGAPSGGSDRASVSGEGRRTRRRRRKVGDDDFVSVEARSGACEHLHAPRRAPEPTTCRCRPPAPRGHPPAPDAVGAGDHPRLPERDLRLGLAPRVRDPPHHQDPRQLHRRRPHRHLRSGPRQHHGPEPPPRLGQRPQPGRGGARPRRRHPVQRRVDPAVHGAHARAAASVDEVLSSRPEGSSSPGPRRGGPPRRSSPSSTARGAEQLAHLFRLLALFAHAPRGRARGRGERVDGARPTDATAARRR